MIMNRPQIIIIPVEGSGTEAIPPGGVPLTLFHVPGVPPFIVLTIKLLSPVGARGSILSRENPPPSAPLPIKEI